MTAKTTCRVMIVDDQWEDQRLVEDLEFLWDKLSNVYPYELDILEPQTTPTEAFEYMRHAVETAAPLPDLVLMDLMFEDPVDPTYPSGIEALQDLRRRFPRLAVILLSQKATLENERTLLQQLQDPMTACLQKPLNATCFSVMDKLYRPLLQVPFVEPSFIPTGSEQMVIYLNGNNTDKRLTTAATFPTKVDPDKLVSGLMKGNVEKCTRLFFRLGRVNQRLVEAWCAEAELGEWKQPGWNIENTLLKAFASDLLFKLLPKEARERSIDMVTNLIEYRLLWPLSSLWSDVGAAQKYLEKARQIRKDARKSGAADWLEASRRAAQQSRELDPYNANCWYFSVALELEDGAIEDARELVAEARSSFPERHPAALILNEMLREPDKAMEFEINWRRPEK